MTEPTTPAKPFVIPVGDIPDELTSPIGDVRFKNVAAATARAQTYADHLGAPVRVLKASVSPIAGTRKMLETYEVETTVTPS